ncbi:MAG: YHS domain-containing protein [Rhodospirillales bacterium]|nr:YHS domain-containing protein [Rhodospirillales bacterium]
MASAIRMLILAVFATAGLTAAAGTAESKPLVFQTDEGVAVLGYDPVAYHLAGKPIKGDPAYSAEYEGATWLFASAENRDRFLADPEAYAPAYGGWCAYGMAKGGKVPIDPAAWSVVDGTLYLNVNKKVRGWWEADMTDYIAQADANWPKVSQE